MKTHAEFLEELKKDYKAKQKWFADNAPRNCSETAAREWQIIDVLNRIEQFEAQLSGDKGAVDIKSQIYCRQLIKSVDASRRIHFLHEENAKLRHLLAEACSLIAGEWSIIPIKELQQWYAENEK